MKRCISALIITIMALSMVACGNDDKVPASEEGESGTTMFSEEITSTEDTTEQEESSEDLSAAVEEKLKAKSGETNQEIGLDFDLDIEAGLLYIDSNSGQVVDENGNPIEAYSYITCSSDGTLLSEGEIMEGYMVDDNYKIIMDEEYIHMAEEYEPTPTIYMDTLLAIADPSKEGKKVPLEETDNSIAVGLVDDGGPYYSDIIYGNWWLDGVNGTCPTKDDLVVGIPHTLGMAIINSDIEASSVLDQFRLIDQETCTLEQIERSVPDGYKFYGFYLQNIEKHQDDNGNMYFVGFLDSNYVAVWGNFKNIKNGDDLFVYAGYTGLSINDVPTFDAAYIEFIN